MYRLPLALLASVLTCLMTGLVAEAQVLDPQKLLDAQTFWDNRDWDWYKENIPFFECPEPQLTTTYYYRWELLTKHLTYGSPNSGYNFTEFIDRPFWSGAYGAISCPAGHQLYEARWLRDPHFVRDYARYWFRTPGAQPRNYSTWLADAVWAAHLVHPDNINTADLLPDLKRNYEGWEQRYFEPEVGLFWQTGHDDGMEFNINSRQTTDILRGAPGFRPTLNAYLWADAAAIARVATLAGDEATATAYRGKADALKRAIQEKLWDPKRQFFFPMSRRAEEADGFRVEARTLTYQTGRFAGSPLGRELIGYVPWQFGLPDGGRGYEIAWKKLTDSDAFAAPFGPSTVERHDPLFVLKDSCCWWSGQSWPYATSQTLKALANLLQGYDQDAVTKADYLNLLMTFARTHRKDGQPYLAEACHPDSGSFEGHDAYDHSEHYFHSSFADLIITGLVGLRPREDDTVEVVPLAPTMWDYFALDRVPYRGRLLSVLWDRDGRHYGRGAGFYVLADDVVIARSERLERLVAPLPPAGPALRPAPKRANFAVNNDGIYFPRATASFTAPETSLAKLIDGNYWYAATPPNRWTTQGSPGPVDWCVLDFGTPRRFDAVKLYFLDDGADIVAPAAFDLEVWDGEAWRPVPDQVRSPMIPMGHRANWVRFGELEATKVRVTFQHADGGRTGLTELEVWGNADGPVAVAPPPAGDLAYNVGDASFPKASASYTSRFDTVGMVQDGQVSFSPSPHNRWTAYESPNASDWVAIDFGKPQRVGRVELAIFGDSDAVQAPESYEVQVWDGATWKDVQNAKKSPQAPAPGQFNEVRFPPISASRLRVVFKHRGEARSGLSELLIWAE